MSAVFDLTNKNGRLAISGPPEIWQDHQISRTGGPMVHCLELLISSPVDDPSCPRIFDRGRTLVKYTVLIRTVDLLHVHDK